MIADIATARDLILAVYKTAVSAESSLVTCYADTDTPEPEAVTTTWTRVAVKHANGTRATLGKLAERRQTGVVFVELFTPARDGMNVADRISDAIATAYNQSEGEVWYHDVSVQEIGVDGGWMKTNVTIQFDYDLVR